MIVYIDGKAFQVVVNNATYNLTIVEDLIQQSARLTSSDGYILKDSDGNYLATNFVYKGEQ